MTLCQTQGQWFHTYYFIYFLEQCPYKQELFLLFIDK